MLEPGECFGHPSLLTGMAPAFTVRAHEQSRARCSTPAARGDCSAPSRRRLRRQHDARAADPHRPHRARPARRRHHPGVGDHAPGRLLRARRAVRERRDSSATTASRRCSSRSRTSSWGSSPTPTPRRRSPTGDALDAPRRAIARTPVPTVPVAQLAIEATVDMLAAGAEHLAVLDGTAASAACCRRPTCSVSTPAARSRCGTRSSAPPTRTGSCGRSSISRSCSGCSFAPASRRATWARAQPSARRRRRAPGRLLDLAPRPGARCRGRGLTSAAPRGASSRSPPIRTTRSPTRRRPGEAASFDAYFERLGSDVNAGPRPLRHRRRQQRRARRQPPWRMSKADWLRTFDECLASPTNRI